MPLKQLLSTFTHREVRDLAWVIASPPLISGDIEDVHWWSDTDCTQELNDCMAALHELDAKPQPLIDHLAILKNQRLGSVFEGLVSYWLAISPNYRALQQNIQLIEDKHTYGEVDFIMEEIATGRVIHLEVAVKFYLGSSPYSDAFRWFGTNTKDQLGKKFQHLKSHQTQLSKLYPKQLQRYCDKPIDAKHCIVKGRLFYPQSTDQAPTNIPLCDQHLRGRWVYLQHGSTSNQTQTEPLKEWAQKTWVKLAKSHWLADLNHQDINDLGYVSKTQLKQIDRAECFAKVIEVNGLFREIQRVFYLPAAFQFPEKR